MEYDIIKDLSLLTNIPRNVFSKLVPLACDCICHCMKEETYEGSNITKVDIGIGDLIILIDDDSVRYKFIPSKSFEDKIRWSLTSNSSVLEVKASESLKSSVINSYKGIL